jgi:hypothetical protein
MVEARAASLATPHPSDPGSAAARDGLDRIASAALTVGDTYVDEDRTPAKGIVTAIIIAVPLWCLIGFLSWLILVR